MIPAVKEVRIRMEQHVCAGTNYTPDINNDGGDGDGAAKSDNWENDKWGW